MGVTVGTVRLDIQFQRVLGSLDVNDGIQIGVMVGSLASPPALSSLVGNSEGAHQDWMLYKHLGHPDGGSSFASVELSVKSMRRIDEYGQTLFLYYQATGGIGQDYEMRVWSSTLLILP